MKDGGGVSFRTDRNLLHVNIMWESGMKEPVLMSKLMISRSKWFA